MLDFITKWQSFISCVASFSGALLGVLISHFLKSISNKKKQKRTADIQALNNIISKFSQEKMTYLSRCSFWGGVPAEALTCVLYFEYNFFDNKKFICHDRKINKKVLEFIKKSRELDRLIATKCRYDEFKEIYTVGKENDPQNVATENERKSDCIDRAKNDLYERYINLIDMAEIRLRTSIHNRLK